MPLKPVNIPSSPTSIKLLSTKVCSSLSPIITHPLVYQLVITPSPSHHQIIICTCVEELQENTTQQIKEVMLSCTKAMEAGSTMYNINPSAAENIWQVTNPLLIFSCRPALLIHSHPSLVNWYTNFLTSLFITSGCTQFEATKCWARVGLHECSSGSPTGPPSLH